MPPLWASLATWSACEAIYQLLQNVDLDSLSYELRDRANNDSSHRLESDEEVEAYRKRMIDRFGPVPHEADELMHVVHWNSRISMRCTIL